MLTMVLPIPYDCAFDCVSSYSGLLVGILLTQRSALTMKKNSFEGDWVASYVPGTQSVDFFHVKTMLM